MPRVKIDYIVSFSSEDPENPASNLLAWDVSKKKWLCNKGEESCSVVLQLAQAVQICTIQVGAHFTALVEVLVGRSEKPNEPFQVLVPRSVFLGPAESRRGGGGGGGAGEAAGDRVRSFGAAALAAPAAQRWDRVRLVCSQPYNKHCKYGLSFVHIFSPEAGRAAPGPLPARLFPSDATSEDEEFSPGELFAQHRASSAASPALDTGAQIRQATARALKNLPDATVRLHKAERPRAAGAGAAPHAELRRDRDRLVYDDDDERPRDRVDRAVDAHNRKKDRDDEIAIRAAPNDDDTRNRPPRPGGSSERRRDSKERGSDSRKVPEKRRDASVPRKGPHDKVKDSREKRKDTNESVKDEPTSRDGAAGAGGRGGPRKRTHSDKHVDHTSVLRAGRRSETPHTLLSDVVFVLSGYPNPRRASLRDTALALGARCERDWTPRRTHLVCAFPNTPKLRSIRAGGGGGGGAVAVAVRGEWLEAVAARRRRLPWQWFATEAAARVAPPAGQDASEEDAPSEDTDDEIERVRRDMKRRRTDPPPPASPASPAADDVVFVRDERLQGAVTLSDSESDAATEPEPAGAEEDIEPGAALPDLFRGRTFAVSGRTDGARLARYVRAYGGLLLEGATAAEDGEADYTICSEGESPPGAGGGARVPASWLWRCLAERRLCPLDSWPDL